MTADEIKAALVAAEPGENIDLDLAIWNFISEDGPWRFVEGMPGVITCDCEGIGNPHNPVFRLNRATSNLAAAIAYIPDDFWWSAGMCDLSGHVTIGPDYNGPHGDRLKREWPEHIYHEGISADLAPGGSVERVCHAICHAVIDMHIAKKALGL